MDKIVCMKRGKYRLFSRCGPAALICLNAATLKRPKNFIFIIKHLSMIRPYLLHADADSPYQMITNIK